MLAAGLAVFAGASFLMPDESQAERSRIYVPSKKQQEEQQIPAQAAPAPEQGLAIPQPAFTETPPGVPGTVEGNPGSGVEGWNPDMSETAPPPEMETPACDFAQWVGQPVNEEALKATGRPYRILPPGAMATMDYSASRINVHTDDSGIVIDVRCG